MFGDDRRFFIINRVYVNVLMIERAASVANRMRNLLDLIIVYTSLHFITNPSRGGIPDKDRRLMVMLLSLFVLSCSIKVLILFL